LEVHGVILPARWQHGIVRAALIEQPGTVTVREVARPAAEGRALIQVAQAGLCGTDVKIASGQIPVRMPRVLGHEMTGWVVRPGPRGIVPAGTPVLVNPAVFCGHCDLCRRDRPQLCRNGALLGRDEDGCFAELVAVDEACLHPLPGDLPAADAGLLQVLSTCVHAQSALPAAESAVVVGLGVSGLLHLQLLAERGVRTLIGITRSAAKRELALRLGAGVVAGPGEADEAVAGATGGRGADVAVESVGTQETLAQAMRLAGAGGTVLAFGTIAPAADGLPTYQWYFKELTILSPRAARPRDCDAAIRLAASRRLELAPLVTARFPLARAGRALTACAEPGQLKVMLDIT
jgi:threonine dehydrogenase-like Zn-dependent dehydrogenase